jgi:hypothetical protein
MPKTPATTSADIALLRERVDRLASEVAFLHRAIRTNGSGRRKQWWKEVAGHFDGDRVFAELVNEGRSWRESQRPKARIRRARP